MSSDLPLFDGSSLSHFCFSPFMDDPSTYFLDTIPIPENNIDSILQNPVEETSFQGQIAPTNLQNVSLPFDPSNTFQSYETHSHGGDENVPEMMMPSSFSENSIEGSPGFSFQPQFGSFVESPNFRHSAFSSPGNGFVSGEMRSVLSTGGLQVTLHFDICNDQRLPWNPYFPRSLFIEGRSFKGERYSAEERKERIQKYRAKRFQRNFGKIVKYACRKSLAEKRVRVHGRFARRDEIEETPKTETHDRDEGEDGFWIGGPSEEGGEETVRVDG
ncbi:hypothetical protein NMG60_11027064 [Bertholletia excelsa]